MSIVLQGDELSKVIRIQKGRPDFAWPQDEGNGEIAAIQKEYSINFQTYKKLSAFVKQSQLAATVSPVALLQCSPGASSTTGSSPSKTTPSSGSHEFPHFDLTDNEDTPKPNHKRKHGDAQNTVSKTYKKAKWTTIKALGKINVDLKDVSVDEDGDFNEQQLVDATARAVLIHVRSHIIRSAASLEVVKGYAGLEKDHDDQMEVGRLFELADAATEAERPIIAEYEEKLKGSEGRHADLKLGAGKKDVKIKLLPQRVDGLQKEAGSLFAAEAEPEADEDAEEEGGEASVATSGDDSA